MTNARTFRSGLSVSRKSSSGTRSFGSRRISSIPSARVSSSFDSQNRYAALGSRVPGSIRNRRFGGVSSAKSDFATNRRTSMYGISDMPTR